MSYIYGSGVYGVSGLEAFKNQLQNVDATIQVRDNNYGLLDNDDVYQYLGGLTMAAKSLSGEDVSVYIADTRTDPEIKTLNQFMANEMRTRILNSKWIEGMLNEGYSGANEISKEIGYLFAWDAVTPEAVKDWMYQSAVETYMFDSTIRSQFLEANPYAFASTAAWFLEAARRGMWVPDAATLTQLKDLYIQATVEYGVVCCHHTCGNLDFTNYVVMGSSLSMDSLQQFADVMEAATGEPVTLGTTGATSQPTGSASSTGASSSVGASSSNEAATESGSASSSASESASESAGTEGTSKSYEVSETGQQSSAQSSMPIVAIVGVILLVCLVGVGYFRNSIFGFFKK
jgi:cobaltochelatase CobN